MTEVRVLVITFVIRLDRLDFAVLDVVVVAVVDLAVVFSFEPATGLRDKEE